MCVDLFTVHNQAQHAGTARCTFEKMHCKKLFCEMRGLA